MSRSVLEFLNVSEFEQEILFPVVWEPPTFDVKHKENVGKKEALQRISHLHEL